MNNSDFIHLHVHSEYSLLDGLGSPKQYMERAVEMGFRAIAITDHGNIDGHLRWQEECKKVGIKPIFGCELYIVEDTEKKEKGEERFHITLLVRDFESWQALARMLTLASLEGFYRKPRIDRKVLLNEAKKGMVILTGCSGSFLLMPQGVELLIELSKNKGVECFLEVMPHRIERQVKINQLCLELSKKFGLPLVATNDCHYIRSDYVKAQEVLLAVQRQAKWKDPDRWKFGFEGLHLRSADEMIVEFKAQGVIPRIQYYQAMANTREVEERCSGFEIPKRGISLPITRYEKEQPGVDVNEILSQLCEIKRKEFHTTDKWNHEHQSRYLYEREIIQRKGFARYFLIVYEIIEWCKKQGIMIGPGRGSVGGSLVAYLLTITQVDPLRYGLLFERFISEDRIDYPDIDLDFEDIKCHLVREHIEKEYGEFNVVGISTFLTMKGRGVIRDVGRVFDLPATDVDLFAKTIDQGEHDEGVVALEGDEGKEGHRFKKRYPEEFRLMTILEGQIRGAGQHPAGLIISGEDLRGGEHGSLCRRSDVLVCNWDMNDCEYNGLIKIDILKLGTLTVLNEAKRLIALRGVEVRYESLELTDPGIFQMLSKGDTAGVFQFSGYACTELCKEMGVDRFEDMVAVTALARPGPADSGMTDLYIKRKRGQKWTPLHPTYEKITKNTYGVMVYQEQMMRAMTDLAGFSNSDADRIRKVIGKKRDPKEFEPYRQAFLQGCQEKKTLTQTQAQEFWQGLLEWASYGFNESHAVEYAMIGFWTAWIKIHYPIEFLCAQLTYGPNKEEVVKEAERLGMKIVTPKVGVSDARRWIAKGNFLYMPFVEIKGIGETQVDKCATVKQTVPAGSSRRGFFGLKADVPVFEPKGKLEKLLTEVRAFDSDPTAGPEHLEDYFQYSFSGQGQSKLKIEVVRKRMMINPILLRCKACGLRSQANRVVPCSLGMYNAIVLGESPGKEEDDKGMGYVGPASKPLWEELADYGIVRRAIHVGNVCKCWPSTTKTPSKKELDECFERWTKEEILSMNCRLILATGNIPLYALTGRESGISSLSGQIEWVEKVKAWVVWCVHPSAVLRNRQQNFKPFREGIRTFAETFNKGIGR